MVLPNSRQASQGRPIEILQLSITPGHQLWRFLLLSKCCSTKPFCIDMLHLDLSSLLCLSSRFRFAQKCSELLSSSNFYTQDEGMLTSWKTMASILKAKLKGILLMAICLVFQYVHNTWGSSHIHDPLAWSSLAYRSYKRVWLVISFHR